MSSNRVNKIRETLGGKEEPTSSWFNKLLDSGRVNEYAKDVAVIDFACDYCRSQGVLGVCMHNEHLVYKRNVVFTQCDTNCVKTYWTSVTDSEYKCDDCRSNNWMCSVGDCAGSPELKFMSNDTSDWYPTEMPTGMCAECGANRATTCCIHEAASEWKYMGQKGPDASSDFLANVEYWKLTVEDALALIGREKTYRKDKEDSPQPMDRVNKIRETLGGPEDDPMPELESTSGLVIGKDEEDPQLMDRKRKAQRAVTQVKLMRKMYGDEHTPEIVRQVLESDPDVRVRTYVCAPCRENGVKDLCVHCECFIPHWGATEKFPKIQVREVLRNPHLDFVAPVKTIYMSIDPGFYRENMGSVQFGMTAISGDTIMGADVFPITESGDYREKLSRFITMLRADEQTQYATLVIAVENQMGFAATDVYDFVKSNFQNVEFVGEGGRKRGVITNARIKREMYEIAQEVLGRGNVCFWRQFVTTHTNPTLLRRGWMNQMQTNANGELSILFQRALWLRHTHRMRHSNL